MTAQTENKEGEKLYAGKFKTVEDLEMGYKSNAHIVDENIALKNQVEQATRVPEDYLKPADIEIEESYLSDIKVRAKETGMTQAQYDKYLRGEKERLERNKTTFENAKKEVGEANLNLLKDYVAAQYPTELADHMLNTFIVDKNARNAALAHREKLLGSKVPGVGGFSLGRYTVTDEDIKKAYDAKEKNKADPKARNHYINLLNLREEQKKAS